MSNPVIKIENLSKEYYLGEVGTGTLSHDLHRWWARVRGKEDPYSMVDGVNTSSASVSPDYIWALRDINLEIQEGDILGIIGKNGAGKSTLLKIISRITAPTKGSIKAKGRIASLLEVGTGMHPELTGRENIYLNGAILGMKQHEITARFDDIVDFSSCGLFVDTPIKRYSTGMRVRLGFAVAAFLDAEILIVDEVLAVGDLQFQKKCLGKMEEIGNQGRTVIFVSHNIGSISALCNKCMLIEQGIIKEIGETQHVISIYNNLEDRSLVVKINPEMRNKGSGLIKFLSASISNLQGEVKNSFLINEDISIEIKMQSYHKGQISFWVFISDSAGRPLLSSHQRDMELMSIMNGKYKLLYKTAGIGLMPGSYSVSAGVFDNNHVFLEWIDNCQKFEVLPCFKSGKPFDGRWGAVNQQATWGLVPQ